MFYTQGKFISKKKVDVNVENREIIHAYINLIRTLITQTQF